MSAPAAVVAVGGYGRAELHPASDVDLLILVQEGSREAGGLGDLISALVMFLWDIGLEIGHAVRSVAPGTAARYFNKTECFCFTEQPFEAGEEREMPLIFSISAELPENIKTVSLSYTIYEKTPKNQVAQLTTQGD